MMVNCAKCGGRRQARVALCKGQQFRISDSTFQLFTIHCTLAAEVVKNCIQMLKCELCMISTKQLAK